MLHSFRLVATAVASISRGLSRRCSIFRILFVPLVFTRLKVGLCVIHTHAHTHTQSIQSTIHMHFCQIVPVLVSFTSSRCWRIPSTNLRKIISFYVCFLFTKPCRAWEMSCEAEQSSAAQHQLQLWHQNQNQIENFSFQRKLTKHKIYIFTGNWRKIYSNLTLGQG